VDTPARPLFFSNLGGAELLIGIESASSRINVP
jgi:hypothetical protein